MARSSSNSASTAPAKAPKEKKRRWYHQVWEVYQMTRKAQPSITWWILLIIVGGTAAGYGIGLLWGQPVYTLVLAIPFSVLGAMFLLARRAETAAYARIEGEPGAVSAALGTIRRGWNIEEQPVAVDPRTQDMVFRAVGRAGVVLVSEGPSGRAQKLLESEKRRVQRLVPSVPVHLVQSGRGEGQVPLPKIAQTVQRQKGKLSKAEVAEVSKRLRAMGAARLPIPKGIDPTRMRPDRKGMRGR